MICFPFFEKIDEQNFLIIGGGEVAAEKVSRLRSFTDRITVIAGESTITGVRVEHRRFEERDLDNADYCICATDERAENARIAGLCHDRGIPVNVADDPELCTFIFPALIKRGDLVVGISTSGSSPAYAARLRGQIEQIIPDHIEQVLGQMSALRGRLPGEVTGGSRRKEIYGRVLEMLLTAESGFFSEEEGGPDGCLIEDEVRRIVDEYRED